MMNGSPYLAPWVNFFVMTATAASSLTGLMFVVITLVTRNDRSQRQQDGIGLFSTPTVMHFVAALFFSAVLDAPWHLLVHPAILLGAGGLCGAAYIAWIIYRTKRTQIYAPDLEDWFWYNVLPLIAYLLVLGAAIWLPSAPVPSLFVLGGTMVLLIFIGIRNAWDVITYIATGGPDRNQPPSQGT